MYACMHACMYVPTHAFKQCMYVCIYMLICRYVCKQACMHVYLNNLCNAYKNFWNKTSKQNQCVSSVVYRPSIHTMHVCCMYTFLTYHFTDYIHDERSCIHMQM